MAERDRSRSPGDDRRVPAPNNPAPPAAPVAAAEQPGDSVSDNNVVTVCSETFCFRHVKGVLLQEVKAAYKKHADRMQSVQGGVSNFETLQQDVKEFQRSGQVPKWCKAKEVLPLKHRLLQEAGSDLQVTPPDGQTKPVRRELLREFPWLEHVWANHRLPEDAPAKDLFDTATKEWEKLQLFGRYYVAAKQQESSREAFTPGALKRDLDEHLTKLLQAVSELTGETLDTLRPKYRLEQEELHSFAELVQKTLATRAAAERMRQTQQTAKLEAKQQQAKEKVQAMDLNQVVAASVTQSLLQVLPTCGVRVPKRHVFLQGLSATQLQLRFAWQMLKGTSFHLLNEFFVQLPTLQQQVVVYSSRTRAVVTDAAVPWPVTLLLTMRGPKFIFGGVTLPRKPRVVKALADMMRRIRTAHMLGLDSGNFNPRLYFPNLEWQPLRCPPRAEAALDTFSREVLQRLDDQHAQQVGRKSRGNYSPLDCLGFQLLRRSGWSAVKSDKDSSFVLLTVEDRQAELCRLLHDREHFELVAETPAELFALDAAVLQRYKTAADALLQCREWCNLAAGKERLKRFLYQRVQSGFSCTSRLAFNLKTYKSPIVPRELEGSQKNYLQPAQKFASVVLRAQLPRIANWVMQDSAEFVRRAESGEFVVPPGFSLYSGDIKQFFPSCIHRELLEAQRDLLRTTGYSNTAQRSFLQMAEVLLASQIAYAPEVDGFYRRTKGAAMGASHAAEACDVYVALRHDQLFVGTDKPAWISWFVRFRDDCLFCANTTHMTPDATRLLQHRFSAMGSNLVLEISPLSREGAVWLDLLIRVTPSGRLMFSTHIKPTNLGHYITADSYHSKCTLGTWTTAELQRYARNSTCWRDAVGPVERLHSRLVGRLYNRSLQDMIAVTWQKWLQRDSLLRSAQPARHRYTALVLPYHRCWQRIGVWGLLRWLEHELEEANIRHHPFRMAFANPYPHLYVKVRNLHRT
ncbi:pldh-t [Symbiodinium sp. CCMP2592]|nr:pldh-t [Symbiodinium sp. CCMP2592]